MSAVRCFAVRRLGPYAGLTQIVQTEHARAFSSDGEVWQIQVVQVSNAGVGAPAAPPAYLNTAIWTRSHGLRALPLDPMFELSTIARLREASEQLAEQLAGRIEQLPFRSADTLELWLLRADSGRPLALIDSRLPGAAALELPRRGRWTSGDDAEAVVDLVQAGAGNEPWTAWIERDAAGGGRVLKASKPFATHLPAADLPALMLCEDWPKTAQQALVENHLKAIAPLLLMLHGLPHSVRVRVEAWAGERASEVARWHHLYPEIADPRLINRALVEAELRRVTDA